MMNVVPRIVGRCVVKNITHHPILAISNPMKGKQTYYNPRPNTAHVTAAPMNASSHPTVPILLKTATSNLPIDNKKGYRQHTLR